MEKEFTHIAGTFPHTFDAGGLAQLDEQLLSLLFKKETFLLKEGKPPAVKKVQELLSRFSRYRTDIFNQLKKQKKHDETTLIKNIFPCPQRLILLITHACQLRCRYCRVRKFSASMTEKVLYRAIELLFTSHSRELQLQFFGGEPLLKAGLVKKGILYAQTLNREKKRDLTFILTTNGIALDKEIVGFLKDKKVCVEYSIDGEVEQQLKARKAHNGNNYYGTMVRNLKYLQNSGIPHYSISVVMPQDASSTFEVFRHLVSLGFRRLQLNYALGVFWTEKSIKSFFLQNEKIIRFLKKRKDIEFINRTSLRREPVVLNAELTVDCDGKIFLESGICLEEDFSAMKRKFLVADIVGAKNINIYGSTPFQNFYRLSQVYARIHPRFRKIILNNIVLGNRYRRLLKSYA